jgi:integrase
VAQTNTKSGEQAQSSGLARPELLQSIRNVALKLRNAPPEDDEFFHVEYFPDVFTTMSRPLWQAATLRGRQKRRRAITTEELSRLLEVAGKRRLLYLTAVYTGLRVDELRKLVWADLHLYFIW